MKRVRVDGELGDVVTDLLLDDADVTAQRLLDTDSRKRVKSTNASSYVTGTANQITVTNASGVAVASLPAVIVPPTSNTTSYLQLSNSGNTSNATLSQSDVLAQVSLANPTSCYLQLSAPTSRVLGSAAISLETVGASSNASVISGSSGATLLKYGTNTVLTGNSSALALAHGTAITATAPTVTITPTYLIGNPSQYFAFRNGASDRVTGDADYAVLNSSSAGSCILRNNGVDKVTVNSSTSQVSNAIVVLAATSYIDLQAPNGIYLQLISTASLPTPSRAGCIAYDSTLNVLKLWTGALWRTIAMV